MTAQPDLNDRSNCPTGTCCKNCRTAHQADLAVYTADAYTSTAIGVMCLTLCATCAADEGNPFNEDELSNNEALTEIDLAVDRHCAHLGISPQQMANQLELLWEPRH